MTNGKTCAPVIETHSSASASDLFDRARKDPKKTSRRRASFSRSVIARATATPAPASFEERAARISVALYDPQPVVLEGLRRILEAAGWRSFGGEASTAQELYAVLGQSRPAVLLADIDVAEPSGLELLQLLRSRFPDVRIVLFLSQSREHGIFPALIGSVSGLLFKECSPAEILVCLEAVTAGRHYYTPLASDSLANHVSGLNGSRDWIGRKQKLTAMECRVLALIADHQTTAEISAALFISPHTVATHRKNISAKLDLRGKHALLKFALEHKDQISARLLSVSE